MSVAKPYESTTGISDWRWRLRLFIANYGVYIALVALLLAATVLTPRLYDVNTIAVVMRQASQLGIVAIGQTMILLVAGLDLSIGGIFIMTSIVVADFTNGRDELVIPAILIALVLGAIVGLGNGRQLNRLTNVTCIQFVLDRIALVVFAYRDRALVSIDFHFIISVLNQGLLHHLLVATLMEKHCAAQAFTDCISNSCTPLVFHPSPSPDAPAPLARCPKLRRL